MKNNLATSFRTIVFVALGMCASGTAKGDVAAVLNTGLDPDTLELLPNGALDERYIIAPGGTGGHYDEIPMVRIKPIPPTWLPDSASESSRWLVLEGSGQQGITVDPGTYFFEIVVDLTGFDAATAQLTDLRYAADNKLLAVVINGEDVFRRSTEFAEEFDYFRELGDLGLGFFQDGCNTIRFEVWNDKFGPSPMGLRLEGAVEAAAQ